MVTLKGGGKLQTFLNKIGNKFRAERVVQIGFMEGATYPDGTSVPLVAFGNEYGRPDKGQPPRSFFRQMIAKNKSHLGSDLAQAVKICNHEIPKALTLIGEEVAGELQDSINEFDGVPLAPATIASKGFDKQLIDTTHMRNSVTYRVVKK